MREKERGQLFPLVLLVILIFWTALLAGREINNLRRRVAALEQQQAQR